MASEGTNHLVTLFLISNYFSGFGLGVFLFAAGVGTAVIQGAAAFGYIPCIVGGLIMTLFSMVGYFGAITQNKWKLIGYVSGMLIQTILEIVTLVILVQGEKPTRNQVEEPTGICIFLISMSVLQLVSILLALTISCRIISGEMAEKVRRQQVLGAA